jgi:hypothetical protein
MVWRLRALRLRYHVLQAVPFRQRTRLRVGNKLLVYHPLCFAQRRCATSPNILTTAFDDAWAKFKASGSALAEDGCAPSTRTLLAKRIIETAQKGERDANRLVEDGLTYLSELK